MFRRSAIREGGLEFGVHYAECRICYEGFSIVNLEFGVWSVTSGNAIRGRGLELVFQNTDFAIRRGGLEEAPNSPIGWHPK